MKEREAEGRYLDWLRMFVTKEMTPPSLAVVDGRVDEQRYRQQLQREKKSDVVRVRELGLGFSWVYVGLICVVHGFTMWYMR